MTMKKRKRPPPIKKKSPDIDIWGMGSENLCNFLSPGAKVHIFSESYKFLRTNFHLLIKKQRKWI